MKQYLLNPLFSCFVLICLLSCNSYRIGKSYEKGQIQELHFTETISFETYDNWMIVEVKINGSEASFRFMYDTGAPNVITPEAAEKLGIKRFAVSKVGDSQGKKQKLEFVKLNHLKIGAIDFENTTAIVAPLDRVPEIACAKLDGFIGANLMKLAKWKIDYEAKTMTFTNDPSQFIIDSAAFRIPFTTSKQGSPYIKVELADSVVYKVELDTGKSGGVNLVDADLSKKMDSIEQYDHYSIYGISGAGLYGASAKSEFSTIYLDSIKMGALNIYNQDFVVKKTGLRLLGMEILKNYTLFLDWQSRAVFLSPFNENANKNEVKKESFGFGIRFIDDQFKIMTLINAAPAVAEGLKLGDQVLQINDANYEQVVLQDFCDFGSVRDIATDTMYIKVKRGEEVLERTLVKRNIVNYVDKK